MPNGESFRTRSRSHAASSESDAGTRRSRPGQDPIPVAEILKRWLKQNKVSKRLDGEAIFQRWERIVGDEMSRHTRIVDWVGGELVVEVDSAPLMNELSTYYRQEILDSIRKFEEFRGIHKLRFRAGSF